MVFGVHSWKQCHPPKCYTPMCMVLAYVFASLGLNRRDFSQFSSGLQVHIDPGGASFQILIPGEVAFLFPTELKNAQVVHGKYVELREIIRPYSGIKHENGGNDEITRISSGLWTTNVKQRNGDRLTHHTAFLEQIQGSERGPGTQMTLQHGWLYNPQFIWVKTMVS